MNPRFSFQTEDEKCGRCIQENFNVCVRKKNESDKIVEYSQRLGDQFSALQLNKVEIVSNDQRVFERETLQKGHIGIVF